MVKSEHQQKPKESNNTTPDLAGTGRASQPLHPSHPMPQTARVDPSRLTPGAVMALQRSIGNRAVAGLLGRNKPVQPHPIIQAKQTVRRTISGKGVVDGL